MGAAEEGGIRRAFTGLGTCGGRTVLVSRGLTTEGGDLTDITGEGLIIA